MKTRPTVAYVARPHSAGVKGKSKPARHSYSLVPAVLDLTSGVFPTGLVQHPTVDKVAEDFEPRTKVDAQINGLCVLTFFLFHTYCTSTAREAHSADDNPEEWRGATIGLQLIGQRLEEEKLIAMLGVIRDALASASHTHELR